MLASDGDLMEGISQEAIALAGHLKLNRLIVLFDDNGISIDGPLSLADSVDQVKRFEAAGWAATRIDGHDPRRDRRRDRTGASTSDRPTHDRLPDHHRLRRADQGRQVVKAHGSPLGADEIKGAREKLGWSDAAVRDSRRRSRRSGAHAGAALAAARKAWDKRLAALDPAKRAEFERRMRGDLPQDKLAAAVRAVKEKLAAEPKEIATRIASEFALEALDRRRCRR